jgi:hypothetical protein
MSRPSAKHHGRKTVVLCFWCATGKARLFTVSDAVLLSTFVKNKGGRLYARDKRQYLTKIFSVAIILLSYIFA